jgi:hypothetical protein
VRSLVRDHFQFRITISLHDDQRGARNPQMPFDADNDIIVRR